MSNPPSRVVKVGGSLFDLPDLDMRLRHWLDAQPPARNVLIAGGGPLVDEIRRWHYMDPLDESAVHWMCLGAMDIMAQLLSQRLNGSLLYTDFVDVYAPLVEGIIVFSPGDWLRYDEPGCPGIRLPESWDVSSDSIAARSAVCLPADELVLLKSADPPSHNLRMLADCGFVDDFLPKLSDDLPPWRIVNLRQA